SCLPKDTTALIALARNKNVETPLLDAVAAVNAERPGAIIRRVAALCGSLTGKNVAVLGLSFKAETDDVRESPALKIIEQCLAAGARVNAHDPRAETNARMHLNSSVRYCDDIYDTAVDCDAVIIATEWGEYRQLDYGKLRRVMRDHVFFDARGITRGSDVRHHGFTYGSVNGP
ncbi:MAG: UDP-glucose 6-dehydrogenase, partial [Candidatus Eremiobacteraeota bacterium]|nr:UDP-glucose 6-dehydrogenase [Candidatus Eremiobacteraeota bacterium]